MTRNLDHLSERDLERLSAYLDDELPEHERSELEARLQQEGRLQAGLEELEGALSYLRRLPQVPAPRNYTLTPEMAGQRERGWRFPVLQFATAMAALMLLTVVFLDAATPLAGMMAGAPAEPAAAPMALEAGPTEAPADAAEQPPSQAMEAEPQMEAGAADLEGAERQAESEAAEPSEDEETAAAGAAAGEDSGAAAADSDRSLGSRALQWLTSPGTLRRVEIALLALVILLGFMAYRSRPART